MSGSNKRVLLGHIAAAHGVRGELVVKSYTGDPAAITGYGPLTDEAGARQFRLTLVRAGPKGVVVRIAGISDRTAAEQLRGTGLYVARDKLPPAEDGSYYHADLIGLAAVDDGGRRIGEIVAVQNFGAGDLLEVKLTGQRGTELVPFQDAFVPAVDIAAGTVTVRVPAAAPDNDDEERNH